MKKIFTLLAILPMLLLGCSENVIEQKDPIQLINENLPELIAGFVDDTRTYVENSKYLRWHEDDRLTTFYGNTLNRQYKFNGKSGDNSGTFSLVPNGELGTGNAFDCIYALYPYSETAKISDEGAISLTLPAVQSYAENSFGRGANTMIAVTENLEDTFLAFKNACGYLKLKLYAPEGGMVKSIEIKGNNGEKIAGKATATIRFGEAPIVTMADDATDTITLDCGDGIILGTTAETATEFWIVIPDVSFTKGFTVVGVDSSGAPFYKSTCEEVIIERNMIQPMAALELSDVKIKKGDLMTYNGAKGVVFYVDDTCVKLVSVFSTKAYWSKSSYGSTPVNTTNKENGQENVRLLKSKGILANFPAFKWCDDYGEGWYLPAYNELRMIEKEKVIINATFSANGYATFDSVYWSSTESDYNKAYCHYLSTDYVMSTAYKTSDFKVVAIARLDFN